MNFCLTLYCISGGEELLSYVNIIMVHLFWGAPGTHGTFPPSPLRSIPHWSAQWELLVSLWGHSKVTPPHKQWQRAGKYGQHKAGVCVCCWGRTKLCQMNKGVSQPWINWDTSWARNHFTRKWLIFNAVQFSSVVQSCPAPCNPTDCSTPGFPVHHPLLELAQTHVRWVSDAIQPSHPLSSSSPALNLSQHQGLFQWVSSSHQVAKILELQLQHQSFQWIFRIDFL